MTLSASNAEAEVDTSALEREIDELGYALYGVTPAEIKMSKTLNGRPPFDCRGKRGARSPSMARRSKLAGRSMSETFPHLSKAPIIEAVIDLRTALAPTLNVEIIQEAHATFRQDYLQLTTKHTWMCHKITPLG